MPNLQTLNLKETKMTEETAVTLLEMLQKNTILEHISIELNSIPAHYLEQVAEICAKNCQNRK